MSSVNSIASEKLARLIGTPKCPALLDVRTDDDFSADPRLVPGSHRRSYETAGEWSAEFRGQSPVVICQKGLKLSHGVAALLRVAGASAEVLEGGFAAWEQSGQSLVPTSKLPPHDRQGRTVWVTRERPKIDRVACPWLIRRFVDPAALFLFVAPSEVVAVAEKFGAAPFSWRIVGEPARVMSKMAAAEEPCRNHEFGGSHSRQKTRLASRPVMARAASKAAFRRLPRRDGARAMSASNLLLHAFIHDDISPTGDEQRRTRRVEVPPLDPADRVGGHLGVMQDFVAAVRGGPPPETAGADNLKSLAMVFAAIESAETGRLVDIEV